MLCLVPGGVLVALSPSLAPGADIHPAVAAFAIGEVIWLAGCGLRLWSMRTLGRYFTREVMVSADQPVVTSGPYRYVRHPSYTAMLLYAVGAGLIRGNWLGLAAITILMLIALTTRIRIEEAALAETLGEPYRVYAAEHKRLVPGVW